MITLLKSSSFKCVERINDSTENLLTTYSEINTALQREKMFGGGSKCWLSAGRMHILFNQDMNWEKEQTFLPSKPHMLPKANFWYPTVYFVIIPLFFPTIISICHEWLKMTYSLIFLRKQESATSCTTALGRAGKAGCAPCSKSVLSSTLRLNPKGCQAQNCNSWIWDRKKRRIHSLRLWIKNFGHQTIG